MHTRKTVHCSAQRDLKKRDPEMFSPGLIAFQRPSLLPPPPPPPAPLVLRSMRSEDSVVRKTEDREEGEDEEEREETNRIIYDRFYFEIFGEKMQRVEFSSVEVAVAGCGRKERRKEVKRLALRSPLECHRLLRVFTRPSRKKALIIPSRKPYISLHSLLEN